MRSFIFLVAYIIAIIAAINYAYSEESWEKVSGLTESNIKEVRPDPYRKDVIYALGSNSLYRSGDNGNTWESVLFSEASTETVNFINASAKGVFICTKNGVYMSNDGKSKWRKIFKGIGEKERYAVYLTFSKDSEIYLGTRSGLFTSVDNGLTWQKPAGEIDNLSIKWIEFLDQDIFIATEKGVYKNSGSGWTRVFVTETIDNEYDADNIDENIEALKPVNSIYVNNGIIFLAANSGIYVSDDKGTTWKAYNQQGLTSQAVKRLLFDEKLYAVTDKGIFIYSESNKLWSNLYKGVNTKDIRAIALDGKGNMFIATKKGLYKKKMDVLSASNNTGILLDDKKTEILDRFNKEPVVTDVQNAAIEYAEVHPDKIKEWRDAAKKKALLPNVSVGLDRYVTDYWHWDSGTNPDTLQKGKDTVSWDITMTWDMGDLIWTSDQTSIDTRSKLMVELRDDIMNEVTRTYFERRRLQVEMYIAPANDLKAGLERELRLQELTADIDAMTGGYFSRQLEE